MAMVCSVRIVLFDFPTKRTDPMMPLSSIIANVRKTVSREI